ncbi:MAG: exonuclease domain-containing protein [Promicromonosporaceae bacterium]|nr:exonuclease domain-containing protein [Promicromonosporaceae bacterium]
MSADNWIDGPLLGFDTETTGVSVDNDRVVTAALVLQAPTADGAPRTEVRQWLIDPGVEIPATATAVHGITTAHARAHGVAPYEALEDIADALAAHLRAGHPVVVYNAAYDLPLLDNELARHGLPLLADRIGGPVEPVLDPLVLDRWQDKWRRGKRKLGDLVGVYDVLVADNLHAADVDVLATLEVLRAIVAKYPALGATPLSDLHEAQRQAHRAWAESFNEWLARQNPDREGASLDWV